MEEAPDLLADLLAAEEAARPPAEIARAWIAGAGSLRPAAAVAEIAGRLPQPAVSPRPWTWERARADAAAHALGDGLRRALPDLRLLLTTEGEQIRMLLHGPSPRTADAARALGPEVRPDDACPMQSAGWRRHGTEADWQALALAFAPGQRTAGEPFNAHLDPSLDQADPEAMDAFLRLHEAAHVVLRHGPLSARLPEGTGGTHAEEIVADAAALVALRPEIGDARADALAARVMGYRDAAMVEIGDAVHWTAPALRAAGEEIRSRRQAGADPAERLVGAVAWAAGRLLEDRAWPLPDDAAWRRLGAAGRLLAAGRRPCGPREPEADLIADALVGAAAHARALEACPPRAPHADPEAEAAAHLRAADGARIALEIAVHRRASGIPEARALAGHLFDAARTAGGAQAPALPALRALALDGDAGRFASTAGRFGTTGLGGWIGRAAGRLAEAEARIEAGRSAAR